MIELCLICLLTIWISSFVKYPNHWLIKVNTVNKVITFCLKYTLVVIQTSFWLMYEWCIFSLFSYFQPFHSLILKVCLMKTTCKLVDGFQNTLSWNMAPCHTEYFKLKEFEKWQVQEELSDCLPEAGCKIFMWEVNSPYLEESSIFISKDGGTPRI